MVGSSPMALLRPVRRQSLAIAHRLLPTAYRLLATKSSSRCRNTAASNVRAWARMVAGSKVIASRRSTAAIRDSGCLGVEEDARDAIDHRLDRPARPVGDHRSPRRLRLHLRDPEIVLGGEDGGAALAVEPIFLRIGDPPQEGDIGPRHASNAARSRPTPAIRSGLPSRLNASTTISRRLYGTRRVTIR